MFLRRTKTVPWGPLVRFVPAFACPKNKQNTQDLCSATGINKTWRRIVINPCIKVTTLVRRTHNRNLEIRIAAPLVAHNHIRERVTGVEMIQVLLMLFCYLTYKDSYLMLVLMGHGILTVSSPHP